jgi:nucleotide-binding universal stress UspA family protein
MVGWNRICCAVDGSAEARAALAHAAALARRDGATLHLVHVRSAAGPVAAPFAPPAVRAPGRAAWALSDWVAQAQAAVPGAVSGFEPAGDPASEIVDHAKEWGCDLIVVGTRPRSGLKRRVLGSVAEEIIREATCLVLVVPRRAARADDAVRLGSSA